MRNAKKKTCILVVDDAIDTLEILERNLVSQDYNVFTASNVPKAISLLESTRINLVITDLKMPKVSGLELVRHIRENYKETEVIMITGYATIESAVDAVKLGVEEYLAKPFTDDELMSAVQKVLTKQKTQKIRKVNFSKTLIAKYGILGQSEAMQKVFRDIEKVSDSNANVLLTGESGTGKELVARAIHYNSKRAAAPMVPVNCGGIPEGLLESELFGYVKGAFTGATETRAGFFQTADGGTIFLDEIGETSMAMQVKLLRVLQDKEVCLVGANNTMKVDVRIIAATNKDLKSLVEKGTFREDMFFRLNVININIPPLRERGDDIFLLIDHFVKKYAREADLPTPQFSEKALSVLKNYYWPGNVRELENVMQHLVIMVDSNVIEVPDLPSLMRYTIEKDYRLDRTLSDVESEYIKDVLASVDGNKTRAAQILGIDRKTLREKLKKQ